MSRQYLELVLAMTDRELRTRYKRAVFGFLWVFINPILQMLVIGTIFSYFVDIPNYFTFLFSGLLPWNFFSTVLAKGTPSFVNERLLIKKAKFPLETIPFSIAFSGFLHLLVSIGLFLALLVILGKASDLNLALLFLSLFWLLTVSLALVLLTSTMHVKYRDVNFITQVLTQLLFYATPILYDLGMIPEHLRVLYYFNPLTSILGLFQCTLVGHCVISVGLFVANAVVSFFLVAIGIYFFRKDVDYLVDWL